MNEGPLGWRDVVRAVDDAKEDILEVVEKRFDRVDKDTEKQNRRMDGHSKRLDDVETKLTYYNARERGIRMVLAGTVTTIVVIGGVLSIARILGVL